MKEILGGILMAVGILIAGASGLCTIVTLSGAVWDSETLSMLPLVLLIGGLPFAVGAGIAYGGYALIRNARRERERSDGAETGGR